MSQRNRRPIKLREIGERFEDLPADLATIIEPMANREYFRLRDTSENIANAIIQDTINQKFINKEILIDAIHNILELTLGNNLFEFLDRYTYYYNNPRISSYVPVHIPGSTFLTKGFVNLDDLAQYITYIIELLFKEFLPQNLQSINSNSFTISKKKIVISTLQYLSSLFHDEGYIGNHIPDILDDYNNYL